MKPISSFLFICLAAVLVLVPACNKESPTATQADPAKAAEKATQGHLILVPRIILLANSGGSDTSAFNVSSAAALYQEALSLDANNADAHFGLALTDLLSIGANPQVRQLSSSGQLFVTPDLFRSLLTGGNSPQLLSAWATQARNRFLSSFNTNMASVLGKGPVVQQNPPSFYQNIVETVILPKLASAISHLTIVTNTANYALLITPQMTGGTTAETYRIDKTEIYLLLALCQFLDADGSVFVSYNIDYNSADSAAVYQAWQTSSGFLTFRTNGSQRMKDARTNFVGMASSIQGSLNHLMNEPPNPEVDIINYNPSDGPAFQQVIMVLDSVKNALSGPITPPGAPTINLKNFFDDAIPNYKQMVPGYTVAVRRNIGTGRYDAELTWNALSFDAWIFPDPTMRGLFPGMTDANLKLLLGLSALNWSNIEVILG